MPVAAGVLRRARLGTWRRGRAAPADSGRVHARRWAILAVLCLSVFLALIDNTIVNVALPSISRQLHAATSDLQWIVDAYSLVFASLLLVGGSLADRYGRKGALQIGLAAFAGFSAFAGLSGSTHVLIVARCLMGLAAALIFPATLAILTNTFTDARERAAAVGIWTGITGLGVALGPVTGGLLLEHFSWSSVFFATIPVAVLALALGAWLLPSSRDPAAPRLDLGGFALSIAAVGAVVYTTIEAPARGWLAPVTLAGFGAGAVLLAVFALWERRVGEPMLDITLFRDIRFSAASFSIAAAFFGLFGFIFLITQYFQFVRGYGPLSTGVRLLPVAVSVGVGSVAGTQLAVRAGTKLIVTTGLVAMAAFYAWVAATISATIAYGIIAAQMVVYGLGLGLTSAPATESIMGAISRAKAGVGSAINDSTRLVGGTLGVAVIGSVYASVYTSRLTGTMPAAVPAPAAAIAHQSVGAAYVAAGKIAALGHPALAQALHHASTNAFLRGLIIGALVAGSVAALGAVLAVLFLPAQPATLTAYQAEPAQTDPHTPDRATPTAAVRPIRRRRLPSRLLVPGAMAVPSSCWGFLPGQGGGDVGLAVGLGGEQADDEGEAHVVASAYLVQEGLVGGDDNVQALQRVAGDRPGVGAVGDGELVIAGGAVEELPGVCGDGTAEVADPVGEAGGRLARLLSDLRELVAEQVDRQAFQAVGHRIRP